MLCLSERFLSMCVLQTQDMFSCYFYPSPLLLLYIGLLLSGLWLRVTLLREVLQNTVFGTDGVCTALMKIPEPPATPTSFLSPFLFLSGLSHFFPQFTSPLTPMYHKDIPLTIGHTNMFTAGWSHIWDLWVTLSFSCRFSLERDKGINERSDCLGRQQHKT